MIRQFMLSKANTWHAQAQVVGWLFVSFTLLRRRERILPNRFWARGRIVKRPLWIYA
jgi:hypothetical protein